MPPGKQQGGFSYLLVLAWLSVLSIMLLRSSEHLQTQARQQREAQLLFAGAEIQRAIKNYQKSAQGNGCFPVSFQQLLMDKRGGRNHYWLRNHYRDPFTQKPEWGMLYDEQKRWIGVYSKGKGIPLKKSGFKKDFTQFACAKSYEKWVFKAPVDVGAPLPEKCK